MDSFSCFLFCRRFPLIVTPGYVFYTSLYSCYLSGLFPFDSCLPWSAVPNTRHHILAAALPRLSRLEVPVRQDGAAHKVLQSISAASSVNRPRQQSRLAEMQESPCHVPSFPPLSAMHLPLQRKVCHTPWFRTTDCSQQTSKSESRLQWLSKDDSLLPSLKSGNTSTLWFLSFQLYFPLFVVSVIPEKQYTSGTLIYIGNTK